MPQNPSKDTLDNRLMNIIIDLQKQVAMLRTNQFIPPAWIAPTFLNSWVNFGGSDEVAGYYQDALGTVHLRGVVKTGTIGTVIFQLPTGYRPDSTIIFPVASNGAFGYCTIDSSGNVTASGGNNTSFSLNGISFRVV